MNKINFPSKSKKTILSLGAESAGNFSVFKNGIIYTSKDFGDLLDDKNFEGYKESILNFLKKEKLKPNIIITDLHPLYKTTAWGKELADKYGVDHIQVQHHHAHIFSQIDTTDLKSKTTYGIALDGTGYGTDGNIWGGECFVISNTLSSRKVDFLSEQSEEIENRLSGIQEYEIQRIGHLENQIMIGGDLAIYEPARILISILSKTYSDTSLRASSEAISLKSKETASSHSLLAETAKRKDFTYNYIKKYYSKNEFELLWNQLQQNFNCQETSSTGRVLDAVSVLLGFAGNERKSKHEATYLLEKNSTKPYLDLKPKITKYSSKNHTTYYILHTTYLFKYLLKYVPGNVDGNVPKDPQRLAATAQLYIAQGLHKMTQQYHPGLDPRSQKNPEIILSGGISNNKIISNYFKSQGILQNKKIYPVKSDEIGAKQFNGVPRGDTGLSFGQIASYLFTYKMK